MKERPIIFSAPMIRAILAGTKSQTRRAFKPQPDLTPECDWALGIAEFYMADELVGSVRCPYGQPGDRLWARETWCESNLPYGTPVISYRAGGCIPIGREDQGSPDYLIHDWSNSETPEPHDGWRSPIYMPRWASRITLEITDVRVQRVQEISEADVYAEGIHRLALEGDSDDEDFLWLARHEYSELWDSINARRGHPWDANPWVWCLSFRRVEGAE